MFAETLRRAVGIVETDVLMVGDFRFPGGTSTAVAAEVRALHAAGYRVALLPYAGGFLSWTRGFHPAIRALIDTGEACLVAPGVAIQTRLACFNHPACFERLPAEPVLIEADHAVLVVHHPPVDAQGDSQYNMAQVTSVLDQLVTCPVPWAPVGPKVRSALASLPDAPPVTAEDWVNVAEEEAIGTPRPGPRGAIPVIGRHSRPDPIKWPETEEAFFAAYPDAADIHVRLLGFDPQAFEWTRPLPSTWHIQGFGAQLVPEFLETIDYFSYYHSSVWIEAFGRSILDAMAAGLPCFLPPDFEPVFGEGALYCEPEAVAGHVRMLQADPDAYARQSARAIAVVRDRYGPDVARARVARLIGPSPKPTDTPSASPAVLAQKDRPRILYLTSNGVGLGHVTRALALARRHQAQATPLVVTMSRALHVLRQEGVAAEYIPFFRSSGMHHDRWHNLLRVEMTELFQFYKPSVVALDANVPYEGLLQACEAMPAIKLVWLRRAMWPPDVGAHFMAHAPRFDVILEPGEYAGQLDRGLTSQATQQVRRVAPVSFLHADEMLPRATARAVLGLDPKRPAVFLQLGAGLNARIAELRDQILEKLMTDIEGPRPQVVIGQWSIGQEAEIVHPDVTVLSVFPFARFLKAFDFAVAMAGYNTFHENLRAGLPTLFLSNEHPEQDEQWLRADWARICGLGLSARAGNTFDVLRGVYALSQAEVRHRLAAACARLDPANGADEAAAFLTDLAYCAKSHVADKDHD